MSYTYDTESLEFATQYFLGNTKAFDAESNICKNMFLNNMSDNNSSTIRELVTLHYLGYQSFSEKHGADGIDTNTGRLKEVKPRYLKEGQKMNTHSGNFNDMTFKLLEKKKDYDMVCSLFYHSHLIYIVEFPISVIFEHLKEQLCNQIEKGTNRKVLHFGYSNYDSDELIVHYYNKNVAYATNCLSKPHQIMLESHLNGKTS
jgi:hypothetical protein